MENDDILVLLTQAKYEYQNKLHAIRTIIQQRPHITSISDLKIGTIVKLKGFDRKYFVSGLNYDKTELLIAPFNFEPQQSSNSEWIGIDKFEIN